MMLSLALVVLSLITILPQTASAMRDYWQQRVKYKIDVTLIDSIHSLEGKLSVQYFNNSPDTLREVYFHLYYLAFQPGSMMQVRADAISSGTISPKILALKESEQGKYRIDQITTEAGAASHEITGTVMKVSLPKPLLPNTSTTISFTYFEQIPKQTRRGGWMSSEGVEYSMAQWYPKIAEYDERGWNANEYIAREFYGVWGDFDVSITLPSSFTVAASGQVQNPQEVGRGYDKIAAGEKSGQAMPEEKSGMTTWKWRAENVHDFAWVADKTYIHDWATIRDSITIHAIYKTSVMKMWTNTLKYTEFMINTMSDLYYPYPYRNFYNTHAGDGGMEYPQLVQNTGFRSELSMAGITAHEGAHQWFYGILGNNEIREAYLDEGFTSYATTQIMVKQFGNEQQYPGAERSWLDWFIPKPNNKGDNYRGYLSLAKSGYEEPLTIPHDWFREDVGAGEVYSKTQAILSMLEYTLGESTFDRGMKEYFNRWKFKHPMLTDFQRTMEDVAHTDLDWFFDQWFSTDRTVDYGICGLNSEETANGYLTTVKLYNNDQAVMPIDLLLRYTDGTSEIATIPLSANHPSQYKKPESKLFFPAWDWVAREYEGKLTTSKRVRVAEIDTSWRLQDLNRWNNRVIDHWLLNLYGQRPHYSKEYWAVWKQLNINPPLDGPYFIGRPILSPTLIQSRSMLDIGFERDLQPGAKTELGVIAGVGLKYGGYLKGEGDVKVYSHFNKFNKKSEDKVEGRIRGTEPIDWLGRLTNAQYFAGYLNGLWSGRLTVEHTVRPEYLYVGPTHKVRGFLEGHNRSTKALLNLPIWTDSSTRVGGLGYHFTSKSGESDLDAYAESSLWGSSKSFVKARATFSQSFDLFLGVKPTFRINLGTSGGSLPAERAFHLQTADVTTHQFSDTYQAYRWYYGRSAVRGGAGLIGHPIKKSEKQSYFFGSQMMGLNLDLGSVKLPYLPFLAVEFYAGAGWIGDDIKQSRFWPETVVTAGATLNLDIKALLPWQLQGVLDQYAVTPVIKVDHFGNVFLGTSF
jgi:hypothetical protein